MEAVVTTKRDKAAVLKLLKRIKKFGSPHGVVTDGCGAYSVAMNEIGSADRHEVSRRLNIRAKNSHQPFRRRERAMQRFRSFEGCFRNSVQFTLRSTIISIRSGISPPGRLTNRDALMHWRSGGRLWRRQPPARGCVAPSASDRCCSKSPRGAQASLAIGSRLLAKQGGLVCANTRNSSEYSA